MLKKKVSVVYLISFLVEHSIKQVLFVFHYREKTREEIIQIVVAINIQWIKSDPLKELKLFKGILYYL